MGDGGNTRASQTVLLLTVALLGSTSIVMSSPTSAGELPTTVLELRSTATVNNQTDPEAGNGLVVFVSQELLEGEDLNEDGVIDGKSSLQVWDARTGEVESLAGWSETAVPGNRDREPVAKFGDGLVAYGVDEARSGVDRNGDGVLDAHVLHVWTRGGGWRSLGMAMSNAYNATFAVAGSVVLFAADERTPHPEIRAGWGQDLTGDGDATDNTAMVAWDARTGEYTPLGVVSPSALIDERDGVFAFVRASDTNGRLPYSVALFDPSVGVLAEATGTENVLQTAFGHGDGRVGLVGLASGAADYEFHAWDASTGLVPSGVRSLDRTPPEVMADGWIAFVGSEAYGDDMNGDPDRADAVLHLWSSDSGSATSSRLALSTDFATTGDAVVFAVNESQQNTDLDGDGLIENLNVVHIWHVEDAAPRNTRLAVSSLVEFVTDGELVAFSATQRADGSPADDGVYVWSRSTGLVDLALNERLVKSRTSVRVDAGHVALLASEAKTGRDLNGDGTVATGVDQYVPTVWEPGAGTWHVPWSSDETVVLGNSPEPHIAFTYPHLWFVVDEVVDRNCDGDDVDRLARIATVAATPAPSPCGAPVAVPGGPYGPVAEGSPIIVDGSGSSDADGTIVSHQWSTTDPGSFATTSDPITGYTPTDEASGTHTLTLEVCDDDGLCDQADTTVTVVNAAPDITAVTVTGPVPEGSPAELTATFTDPGVTDTHTATINWGDGTPLQPGTVTAAPGGGGGTVTADHVYTDEGPGSFPVTVCVEDDDSGGHCSTTTVTVTNEPPEVTAGPDQETTTGTPITLNPVSFHDPGVDDTHTATIDWGDGSTPTEIDPADSPFDATHTYTAAGTYTVTIRVTDNDGATGTATTTITAEPGDGCDIRGTSGPDVLVGTEASETICGFGGDDIIFGLGGNDVLLGGSGDDVLVGGDGNDLLNGQTGRDRASWATASASINANLQTGLAFGEGVDMLVSIADMFGSPFDDALRGNGGPNQIWGGDGADQIAGEGGDDVLRGGDGPDQLGGNAGEDKLHGDRGDDELYGDAGDDQLFGGPGSDLLRGGDGGDELAGDTGNDDLGGGAGDDTLNGGDGRDVLHGNDGDDTLIGGDGADLLFGNDGSDQLDGNAGDDSLWGGNGNDTLHGGTLDNRQRLDGGSGTDTCSFGPPGETRRRCERP